MPDDPASCRRALRELVELERAAGVAWQPRPDGPQAAPAERSVVPRPSATRPHDPARQPNALAVREGDEPTTPHARLTDTPSSPESTTAPAPASTAPPFDCGSGSSEQRLTAVVKAVATCQACGLCHHRRQPVPGEGDPRADLLFIGEGPGADEDRSGRPFVGPAGQLLDKMIAAMGLTRNQVFIANVVKCRPPGNRNPEPDEVAACLPYLKAQIQAIGPAVICTLGNTPLRALRQDTTLGITRQRGRAFTYEGITCVPTFHPSYLLRNEAAKRPAWEDLKQVLGLLGREPPRR